MIQALWKLFLEKLIFKNSILNHATINQHVCIFVVTVLTNSGTTANAAEINQ